MADTVVVLHPDGGELHVNKHDYEHLYRPRGFVLKDGGPVNTVLEESFANQDATRRVPLFTEEGAASKREVPVEHVETVDVPDNVEARDDGSRGTSPVVADGGILPVSSTDGGGARQPGKSGEEGGQRGKSSK